MRYPNSLVSLSFTCSLLALGNPSIAADFANLPDRSWISLNGTVVATTDDAFRLDYGDGVITVEMDDWDWYKEGAAIVKGDRVTVGGRIDKDLFETQSIEAGSVYVEGLNRYYYANPADEEMEPFIAGSTMTAAPEDGSLVSVTGTVSTVNGREFILNQGDEAIRVDTRGMAENPLDDEGQQQIRKGDRVNVTGELDMHFFKSAVIEADSIVSLYTD